MNDIRRASRSDLRYATHESHEHEDVLSNAVMEEGEQHQMQQASEEVSSSNPAQEEDNEANNNNTTAALVWYKVQNGRKRTRMLRFLDKRLARLQVKYNKISDSQSSAGNEFTDYNKSKSHLNNRRRLDYEQRKALWAAKYTSVNTLRQSFGKNKNRLWGDFDPTTTRKLYHTLLPHALLELRELRDGLFDEVDSRKGQLKDKGKGLKIRPTTDDDDEISNEALIENILNNHIIIDPNDPDYLQQELKELAPLAYQARLAAKKYARERSRLPGRIGSMLYDGYRSWRRYGKWKSSGMTWEQVWNKYEDQVLREAESDAKVLFEECLEDENCVPSEMSFGDEEEEGLDDEELTARICLRILERSVVTNDAIDKLFLKRLSDEDDHIRDEPAIGEPITNTMTTIEDMNVTQESKKRQTQRRQRIRKRKFRIQADLRSIETKFDDDIRELLRYSTLTTREGEERRSRRKTKHGERATNATSATAAAEIAVNKTISELNLELDERNSINKQDQEAVVSAATSSITYGADADDDDDEEDGKAKLRKLAVHEVFALRILAATKQRITSLQALPTFGGETGGSDTETEEGAASVNGKNDQ